VSPTPTWHQASHDLARRVRRRAREAAVVGPLALGLLAGAVAALASKAAGVAPDLAPALPLVGTLLGLLVGLARASRVPPAPAWAAAWALDRIAGARERGLTAALVDGPAAAEAAFGRGRVEPPAVRLKPPPGLATAVGAALLAAIAVAVPPADGASAGGAGGPTAGTARTVDGADGPSGAGARASERASRAEEAERVREALGLSRATSSDPAALAERLADPAAREAARKAATRGGDLEALLGGDSTGSPGALAGALERAAADGEEVSRLRAEEAAARALAAAPALPPSRRAVVERYVASLAAEGVR
jgi:hypothetical protein